MKIQWFRICIVGGIKPGDSEITIGEYIVEFDKNIELPDNISLWDILQRKSKEIESELISLMVKRKIINES